MGDLFSDAANERLPETAPLALRMRPQRLEDFVGQVDEIDTEKGKVRVLVNMFGRETPITLDFLEVEKL